MNREIKVERHGNPKFMIVHLYDDFEEKGLDELVSLISCRDYLFCGVKINDWNSECSPWPAKAVFGKDDFKGNAPVFLKELEETIKDIQKEEQLENIPVYLGGYSLAGLFALWAGCKSECFEAVAAVSASFWYPDFVSFMENNRINSHKVYLSLGNKEKNSRNPLLRTVEDCYEKIYEILLAQKVDVFHELNEGNHFVDGNLRMAKAYNWLTGKEV